MPDEPLWPVASSGVSLGSAGIRTLSGDYGLQESNGAAVNTAAIQAAANDCITNGRNLHVGADNWRINAPLVINGRLRLIGAGGFDRWGSVIANGASPPAVNNSGFLPSKAPLIDGGGFIQTADNADILQITGAGEQVDLRDLSLLFANTSGPYKSTGHGVNVNPPVITGGRDHGNIGGAFSNVRVVGHDGSHYGFVLTNCLYNKFERIRSYGGGGLHYIQNSTQTEYGNAHFDDWLISVAVGGTAHGIFLDHVGGSAADFMTFSRVQSGSAVPAPALPGAPAVPTNAQQLVAYNGGNLWHHIVWLDADFETQVSANVTLPAGGPGNRFGPFAEGSPQAPITNPLPALNPGTWVLNAHGTDLAVTALVTLNPTGAAAATATIQLSRFSNGSSAFTITSASLPISGPAGTVLPLRFAWPCGVYANVTTLTNAALGTQTFGYA